MSMLRLPMFPGALESYPMVGILEVWNSDAARFLCLISRLIPWSVEVPKAWINSGGGTGKALSRPAICEALMLA